MTPTANLLRLTTSILSKAGMEAICILCVEPDEQVASATLGFSAEFVPLAIAQFKDYQGKHQICSGAPSADVDYPLQSQLIAEGVRWFASIPLEIEDGWVGEMLVGTRETPESPLGLPVLKSVAWTLCQNLRQRWVEPAPPAPAATAPAATAPPVAPVDESWVEADPEQRSLVEHLYEAIQQLWSGTIEAFDADDSPMGQILLSEGRIAWARCRGQSETLGPFLWRLGRITREQLARAQEIYQQHGGQRKLGAILEEEGLMSRPVLRRCLLLHTRSAIEELLSYPDARATTSQARLGVDEKIVFGPEEVLPLEVSTDLISEWMCPDNTWVRSWYSLSGDNAVLTPLARTAGYLAAAIISHDGEVLAGHVEHPSVDLSLLAILVASMAESSSRAVASTKLRAVDLILLDCAEGWLVAHWLDDKLEHLVLLLLGESANATDARELIKSMVPALQIWLRNRDPSAAPS